MSDHLDIKVGTIRLACQISGVADGRPMVLLHALGERGADWDAVRAEFDPYYRVLTIDLRRHGDSDWPGSYTYEVMRDDVLGVLDQLAMDQVGSSSTRYDPGRGDRCEISRGLLRRPGRSSRRQPVPFLDPPPRRQWRTLLA